MSGTVPISLSVLEHEALKRVRGYCHKVEQVGVMRTGETFIVRVTGYGQSLQSAANRAALYAQSELRRLVYLDCD
jgi:hypothetical protein